MKTVSRSCLMVLAAVLALGAPRAARAGVNVGVVPASSSVAPGEEFTLDLAILDAGSQFNGFDAVVEFDPSALTFLPAAPLSQQEGVLMTGACGATFHRFVAAADSLTITDVLLCAGQSLTGPGPIYRLRFRAGNTPGNTWVRLRGPRVRFYDAGLYVFPVATSDAEVQIGDVTGAQGDVVPAGLSVRAVPNPARGGTTLELAAVIEGPQRVSILDARGRRVREFVAPSLPAGRRTLHWDGRDGAGRRVAAGGYRVIFRAGTHQVLGGVTLLP